MISNIDEIVKIIKDSNNVVFFVDAWVSNESGIPDFRFSDGQIWSILKLYVCIYYKKKLAFLFPFAYTNCKLLFFISSKLLLNIFSCSS